MPWAVECVEARDAVAEATRISETASDAEVAWFEAISQSILPKVYDSYFSLSVPFRTFYT
jgi:hypothetical protein